MREIEKERDREGEGEELTRGPKHVGPYIISTKVETVFPAPDTAEL